MASNQSATKKAKFTTPDRCLLVQAALWFVDGVKPIPDEAFLLAPKHFSSEQPDFSELFRALKIGGCNLRGDLILDFQPDLHSIVLVQNHPYPRFQHPGYEFNLEGSDLKDVDFTGSSIKYQSDLIREEAVRKPLDDFKSENFAGENWRAHNCIIRNVSVRFSDVRALFSGEIGKAEATGLAKKGCQEWLLELMCDGDSEKTKDAYFAEAQNKFERLSRRGFNEAWENAVRKSGNLNWSKPGRKS